jgi:hypothetical protein
MSMLAVCKSFDTAFRLASLFIPIIVQYAGYMIPVQKMKRWLFWIVGTFYFRCPLALNISPVVLYEPRHIR